MRNLMLATAIAISAALTAAAPSALAALTACPPGGAADATFGGGLRVTDGNYCLLDNVTVNGPIIVESGGVVDLESSTANGGVRVRPGGEIEVGVSLFGGEETVSTIRGGLRLRDPIDWDVETARIYGGVRISGLESPEFEVAPTFCGNTVKGGMSVSNASVLGNVILPEETWIGDPEEPIIGGTPCFGNTIYGSLSVRNSAVFVVKGNKVTGSVFLTGSTVEVDGNRIGGSLFCRAGTVVLPPEPPGPTGNTVRGRNTCG